MITKSCERHGSQRRRRGEPSGPCLRTGRGGRPSHTWSRTGALWTCRTSAGSSGGGGRASLSVRSQAAHSSVTASAKTQPALVSGVVYTRPPSPNAVPQDVSH